MTWFLLILAGGLLWVGAQITLAGGDPLVAGGLAYVGWTIVLFTILRWLLPAWPSLLRFCLAVFIPLAIAIVVISAWLRLAGGSRRE